jgi:hypothetical protein
VLGDAAEASHLFSGKIAEEASYFMCWEYAIVYD